jgi:hypothetical protein
MKKNKTDINTFVVLTIISLAVLAVFVYKQRTFIFNNTKNADDQNFVQKEELVANIKMSIENEGEFLLDTLKIKNRNGESISIKEIASRHNVVFRYTTLSCYGCVDEELKNIKQTLENQNNPEKLCLLVYSEEYRKREVLVNLKIQDIKLPVYFTDSLNIGISVDDNILPYYFCINTDLRISELYIPVIWNPNMSKFYLQQMISRK